MSHNIKEEKSPEDDRASQPHGPDCDGLGNREHVQESQSSGEAAKDLAEPDSEPDQRVIGTDADPNELDHPADVTVTACAGAPADPAPSKAHDAELERLLAERDQSIAALEALNRRAAEQRQRLERDISFRQAQAEALEDDLEQERAALQELLEYGSLEELLATTAAQREQLATLEHYIDNRNAYWRGLESASVANKDQLRDLEHELLARVTQIEQLENRARQAEAEVAGMGQQLLAASLASQLDDGKGSESSVALEAEVAEWQKHSETLRAELTVHSKRLAKDRRTIDGHEREISRLKKRLDRRDRQIRQLKDQLAQPGTVDDSQGLAGSPSNQQVATFEAQLGDMRSERAAVQQRLDDQIASNQALSRKFDELQGGQASSTAALATAESKLAALSQVIADQEAELADARQALVAASGVQDSAVQTAVEAAGDELRQRVSELEAQLDTGGRLQQQVGELTVSREAADQLILELRQQLGARDEELDVLRKRLARLVGLKDSIRDLDDRMPEVKEGDFIAYPEGEGQPDQLLVCLSGGEPAGYPINKEALTIGRTSDNDIQIDTNYVSRRHAQLIRDGDELYIEDLHSKNGVYVNALRVAREKLEDGDQVTIGKTRFRYRLSANGSGHGENSIIKH